ncbi:hypothetical protein [Nitrosovibrio sp. Nv6]|uniref:hypothetical protein n=1 Tax=Nitrosovibrio sp. Nv6 TaxID=1855340 RepID=UPI0008D2819D|nr:hypothetical protein [Nitrosovibrio sp. Nv6]SEP43918.1 hypothetical protein SAMN05216316_3157 [Nitrosovibrio sp. Nv6]
MPLYHSTHRDLESDSLIHPGNWGKFLLEMNLSHPSWAREIALEAVRAWHYADKPSRLKSTFACDTIEAIRCYKAHHCSEGFIYEVEIVDIKAPKHKGDFNAVEPLPTLSDDMWSIALRYWQYNLKTNIQECPGVECSEIVTASPLKVVRKII